MPARLALLSFLAVLGFAAPAAACGPVRADFFHPLMVTVFAVPPTVLATLTLAVFASRWNLGFWGWLKTSVASFGAAAICGSAGLLVLRVTEGMLDFGAEMVVASTSPLLGAVAYVMWIRSRRNLRVDEEANDAA